MAQSRVRIKTYFNRGHATITAHMTKRVSEIFSNFIHVGTRSGEQRFWGNNLKDGGLDPSTFGEQARQVLVF
jgi:hypothetical protein